MKYRHCEWCESPLTYAAVLCKRCESWRVWELMTPHKEVAYVIETRKASTEAATVVDRTGTRVQPRGIAPRLPIKRNDGNLGGVVGRERSAAIDRLREMRTNYSVGRQLTVWPSVTLSEKI